MEDNTSIANGLSIIPLLLSFHFSLFSLSLRPFPCGDLQLHWEFQGVDESSTRIGELLPPSLPFFSVLLPFSLFVFSILLLFFFFSYSLPPPPPSTLFLFLLDVVKLEIMTWPNFYSVSFLSLRTSLSNSNSLFYFFPSLFFFFFLETKDCKVVNPHQEVNFPLFRVFFS